MAESTHADLLRVCGGPRERAKWIRARVMEAIARAQEERRLGHISPAEARIIAEAKRLHIDLVATLRERIAQVLP
jgi:hypothetical protein